MSKLGPKATVSHFLGRLPPKPKRARSNFYVRYVVSSADHPFVGRIYDLGIVQYKFDTYEEMLRHDDIRYLCNVSGTLINLADRIESLNLVGNLLWPDPLPSSVNEIPISRYEWLTVATDVFLMRYISVVDCVLILAAAVFEFNFPLQQCTLPKMRKHGLPSAIADIVEQLQADQGNLRIERNARVHHGSEREFTDDDRTFRTASLFNDKLHGMVGTDKYGRAIDVDRSFREGLVNLQRDFNRVTRSLKRHLDGLYDQLWDEFEIRFGPRIAASTHGLNAHSNLQK
ncbi:hypothetical protein [Blastomonas fulva]|uniref:hypothetical protein n=1 Tax=Blastomonas fulva TaxID=1550728 RepID=UPI003F707D1D